MPIHSRNQRRYSREELASGEELPHLGEAPPDSIEPCGSDSMRVRATVGADILEDLPGRLLDPIPAEVRIEIGASRAQMNSSSGMKASVKVQIKYLAGLRDRTGRRQEEASFPPGATLQDVAGWLNQRYTLSLPSSQVMAILNGRGWDQLPAQLATEIEDGDTICLFPPIAGG